MDAINDKSMERIYLLKNIWCLSVCPRHNSWCHTSYNPKPSEKQFLTHPVIGSGVKGSHVWTLCGSVGYSAIGADMALEYGRDFRHTSVIGILS